MYLRSCAFFSLPFLLPGAALAELKPGAWRGQSITEFSVEENERMKWTIVNDGVMGGLSQATVEHTEGGSMKFTGTLSLENNGGFSSVRSGPVDLNLSNDLGILLLVKGDGRTYQVRLESDARYRNWPVSFAGEFETVAGEWKQVKVPFKSFRGGFRGLDLPDAVLDPADIREVSLLLADKKPGPFALEVAWIRTYGKGQGDYRERKPVEQGPEAPISTESELSVIERTERESRLSIFKKALDSAGLTVFFGWDNPKTVFAPSDEAFSKLPEGTLERLLDPANKEMLVEILSHHVVSGSHSLASGLEEGALDPVRGGPVSMRFREGRVRVGEAALIDADLRCRDGMVHVIDSVLIPSGAADRLQAGL